MSNAVEKDGNETMQTKLNYLSDTVDDLRVEVENLENRICDILLPEVASLTVSKPEIPDEVDVNVSPLHEKVNSIVDKVLYLNSAINGIKKRLDI